MAQTIPGYQEDLAYIHDVGFGGFALRSAPGLLSILRRSGLTEGLVVDLGCGSGLWAHELSGAGYRVLGIDISPAMLKIARRRVPEARFRRASFLDCELPSCDAITAIGECCNYLFDIANGEVRLVKFFGRVYRALRPGGMFIFDVAEPGRGGRQGLRQKNCRGDDWALLLETEEDVNAALLTRRITTFRRVGSLFRRSDEIHRLRLYRGPKLARVLRDLGFRTHLVRGYGEFRFPNALIGLIARKP
jgi:SAM-dependent methyltransferase